MMEVLKEITPERLIYLVVGLVAGCFAMIQLMNSRRMELYRIKKDSLEGLSDDISILIRLHHEIWDKAAWLLPVYKEKAGSIHNGHEYEVYLKNNNDALRVQAKNMLEIISIKFKIDARREFCSLRKKNDAALDLAYIACFKNMPKLNSGTYRDADSDKYVGVINNLRKVSILVLGDEMKRAARGSVKENLVVYFCFSLILFLSLLYIYHAFTYGR